MELVKRDEETLPKGHGLHAETWRCPSGLSLAPRSGIGVGGEAESGREAPARGESLSVHPAPTPGLLSVLCILPKLTWTPRASNACLLCPLSCFAPSASTFSITLSFCLCPSLAVCLPFLPPPSSASFLSLLTP